MSKAMVCIWAFLVSAALACAAQTPVAPSDQQPQSGSGQKVIRDAAEYNAYINAVNIQDPAQKAAAMEAFVDEYPASVVREDALEQALAAYQQTNKQADVERIARKILELNENNLRALAILVAFTRDNLTRGVKGTSPSELLALAHRGIEALPKWEKPEGQSDNDFQKLQKQMQIIFYGGAGLAALQQKHYMNARDYYTPAVAADPDDLANTYQLSIADLEMATPDVRGFWYVAHAIHLYEKQKNTSASQAIAQYGLAKYQKFHGSREGWDQVLSVAATTNAPPRDFHVTQATPPSAADDGTSASLTSNSSPGNAHAVTASALSADRASAGIGSGTRGQPSGAPASALSSTSAGAGHSTPASVLSSDTPGTGHTVPASVLSANTAGAGHNMPAGARSSTAASILQAASASASAVGQSLTSLRKSLSRSAQAAVK